MRFFLAVWILWLTALASCASSPHARFTRASDLQRIDDVLNDLHAAASDADESRYFDLFDDGAVFIGTDATERWTIEEFRAYAHAVFSTGVGWTYTPTTRHIDVSSEGNTAWFDELLDNAKYGTCRGTGVLVRHEDGWKIAQYHLTVPIPNDLLPDIARQIRQSQDEPH